MRIDEAIQQPGIKERMLKDDIMKSLHVSAPGEIVSYDPATRTATIQPVIRDWKAKDPPPVLLDVPIFFWGNFTFTPQKGDGCLVVFADSCIDSWLQSGGVSSPVVARFHSLSDGFAFVGFRQTGGTDLLETLQNKVNEPQEEGTVGQVLSTDGNGGRVWRTVQGGGGGTADYTELFNKPQINSVTLVGNKSLADIGAAHADEIIISDTQPSDQNNKLWVDSDNTVEYTVPTYAEHQALQSAVNGKITEPTNEGTSGQVLTTDGNGGRTWTTVQGGGGGSITDVKVYGTSVVTDGVANILPATMSRFGVVVAIPAYGISSSAGALTINKASDEDVKTGSNENKPIVPYNQDASAFYGLAKAAGDSTQASSSNSVGTYTDDAKSAIRTMIGAGTYSKPSSGIPATDLASGVIPSVPTAYASNPAGLGTASPGSSTSWARGDHVHTMPTAANVGAIAAPSSPATGAFLVYNGTAWVAQTLSTWQGGSY